MPELLPQLVGLQMPANFVPTTNDILGEMHRRGVSRDKLLTTLQMLGSEVPTPVVRMLQSVKRRRGVATKVLSDCNSVFISHILTGAKLAGCVDEVITNAAAFERLACDAGGALPSLGGAKAGGAGGSAKAGAAAGHHRLVIAPRHPDAAPPHGCRLCPSNLCKGAELQAMLRSRRYGRVVYAGDGANDIHPALLLGEEDVLLARAGHALAAYVEAAAAPGAQAAGLGRVRARVVVWSSHDELERLVAEHAR